MAELKPGWQRVKFGEVVRLSKERCADPITAGIERYIGLEHLEPGDLRVRSWGDVADGTTFTTRVRPGQVLFGKRRAYQRKVALADFDAVCSGDIYVFESADPNRLLPDLLPFLCMTDAFFDHAVGTSAGSLSPRTNWTSLAEYEFLLPQLEEQRRIAHRLAACELTRIELDRAYTISTQLRDRLRIDMSGTSPNWQKLDNCLFFLTSGSRGWSRHYSTDGETFLRIGNLNSPTIDLNLSDIQHVRAPNDAEAERTQARRNDVLLGITGEAGLGLVGIVRDADMPTFISQHIALIRLDESKYWPEFLAHFLSGPAGQQQIARFNQAGAKAGMTLLSVRELKVPDLPIKIQQQWSEHVSAVEQAIITIQQRQELATTATRHMANAVLMG